MLYLFISARIGRWWWHSSIRIILLHSNGTKVNDDARDVTTKKKDRGVGGRWWVAGEIEMKKMKKQSEQSMLRSRTPLSTTAAPMPPLNIKVDADQMALEVIGIYLRPLICIWNLHIYLLLLVVPSNRMDRSNGHAMDTQWYLIIVYQPYYPSCVCSLSCISWK